MIVVDIFSPSCSHHRILYDLHTMIKAGRANRPRLMLKTFAQISISRRRKWKAGAGLKNAATTLAVSNATVSPAAVVAAHVHKPLSRQLGGRMASVRPHEATRPRLLSECKSGNIAAGWHDHTTEVLVKQQK